MERPGKCRPYLNGAALGAKLQSSSAKALHCVGATSVRWGRLGHEEKATRGEVPSAGPGAEAQRSETLTVKQHLGAYQGLQ